MWIIASATRRFVKKTIETSSRMYPPAAGLRSKRYFGSLALKGSAPPVLETELTLPVDTDPELALNNTTSVE
jgi:hypothetical protein